MTHWKNRAEIKGDVVFFRYTPDESVAAVSEIFIWDLDKTYLDTKFETLRGLVRTIVEKAFQKKNVPGTGVLVRALRNSWQQSHLSPLDFPIFFITASPPQMERRIHEKLNLDGIYPYGIFCKDNLKNLRPSRIRRLTHQVGYKLQALLQLRTTLSDDVRQILWGDDSESDANIYSLYSDLCSGRISRSEASKILKHFAVTGPQITEIFELLAHLPDHDPVEKIYINLAADTDAEYYQKFGSRIVPTYSSFQTALDLFQDGRLSGDQVVRVAKDLIENYSFTVEELESNLEDLIRRAVLRLEAFQQIIPILKTRQILAESYEPLILPKSTDVVSTEAQRNPIDYLHDYR